MSLSHKANSGRSRSSHAFLLAVAVALLALVFALGCGGKPGLVGTWYSAGEDTTWEFTSDGDVLSDDFGGVTAEYRTEDGKITISIAGMDVVTASYILDGDTLKMTDVESGETVSFVRQKSGATGGVNTTAQLATMDTEQTDVTLDDQIMADVPSVDPALFGTWYNAEAGETLEFMGDGTMFISYDTQEGVLDLVYSVSDGVVVFTDGEETFTALYSIDGGLLTMVDPDTGGSGVYERIAG